jgi:hypothetical protein
MTRRSIPLIATLLATVACGGNTPGPDRSSEAIALCESEVAKRLATHADTLTYDSSASRLGSGAWDVKGTVAGPTSTAVPFVCGVYADGDRDDGPLRADGVKVPASPQP